MTSAFFMIGFEVEDNQYFGVPLANIEAARSHGMKGRNRSNTSVPSRSEVATLPAKELHGVLFAWINYSATEIIPSRAQIYQVLEVLKTRKDYRELNEVAEMCADYILGD